MISDKIKQQLSIKKLMRSLNILVRYNKIAIY